MNKFNDKRIITSLIKSPEEGLSIALDTYGGAVKTICKNILSDCKTEDIEESISDTFFKLWKNIDKFKDEKNTSLKSYIYAIARNTALDKRRSLKCENLILPIEEDSLGVNINMEDKIAQELNNKIIHNTIDNMDEPDKSIFILRYFYFKRVKDIGIKLNLSSKKVENSLFRNKEKLKKSLIEGGIIYE
ncbi:RNA polymerase sigma factor [Terrisporobacter vanillatitrophus]|uniref:RNA polymerase sigma factor n=1 Tax=Terrisporobacter vanillatitrophus TaxID=3058402 RepID=UPI003367FCA2